LLPLVVEHHVTLTVGLAGCWAVNFSERSPGSPLWHPKGIVIWRRLEEIRGRETVQDDRRPAGHALLALTVGLCMLSPHYQMTYYLLVAAGVKVVGLDTVEARCRLAEKAGVELIDRGAIGRRAGRGAGGGPTVRAGGKSGAGGLHGLSSRGGVAVRRVGQGWLHVALGVFDLFRLQLPELRPPSAQLGLDLLRRFD